VSSDRITVIPYGINNAVPVSDLTRQAARQRLGIATGERVVLFFGQIAPYKGLEHLVDALTRLARSGSAVRLLIAGRVDPPSASYWEGIERVIARGGIADRVTRHLSFIGDEDIEVYFKATDAVVLPYIHIYQSGVAFLAYSFGVPLIVTDVGSLREDVVEGVTGFLCRPRDPGALARAIDRYFASDLYRHLTSRQQAIRDFALKRHSWDVVGEMTSTVYASLEAES
jgi:glycosyltransferase involved in cell wall biosynthesis